MTHDPTGHDDAHPTVDALADLFDQIPPGDRPAAEEELRDAGIDPVAVERRMQALAGRGPVRIVRTLDRRRSTTHPERGAPTRARRLSAAMARIAATLLVGIGIGWWLFGRPDVGQRGAVGTTVTGRPHLPNERGPGGESWSRSIPEDTGAGAPGAVSSGAPPTHGAENTEPPAQPPAPSTAEGVEAPMAEADAGSPSEATAPRHDENVVAGRGDLPDVWTLGRDNWQVADGLLPEPVLARIARGDYEYTVHAIPDAVFHDNYGEPFWKTSAENEGRYALDDRTCALREERGAHHVAGQLGLLFPRIRGGDPGAACQVMWNVEATNAVAAGWQTTLQVDAFPSLGRPSPASVPEVALDRRITLDWQSVSFLRRPPDPIRNPERLRASSVVRIVSSSSSDLIGIGLLTQRFQDGESRDAVSLFQPTRRRIRLLSPASRSDDLAGLPALDELGCFDGRLEDFEWRVLGAHHSLVPLLSPTPVMLQPSTAGRLDVPVPAVTAVFEQPGASGAPWHPTSGVVLVPRPVWVVEAVPRDPYYLFAKLVLYVDRELYRPYWLVAHGRDGKIRHHLLCAQLWSKNADHTVSAATTAVVMRADEWPGPAFLVRVSGQALDLTPRHKPFSIQTLIER